METEKTPSPSKIDWELKPIEEVVVRLKTPEKIQSLIEESDKRYEAEYREIRAKTPALIRWIMPRKLPKSTTPAPEPQQHRKSKQKSEIPWGKVAVIAGVGFLFGSFFGGKK